MDKETTLEKAKTTIFFPTFKDEYKSDIDFIKQLSTVNPLLINYGNRKVRGNLPLVLQSVKKNGLSLQFVKKRLRDNVNVVLAAVSNNGHALEFASSRLKNERTVVFAAINNTGLAYQYVGDSFKNNEGLIYCAIGNNLGALSHLPEKLAHSKEFMACVIKKYPFAINYLCDDLRSDPTFIISLLDQNCNICDLIPEEVIDDLNVNLFMIFKNVQNVTYISEKIKKNDNFMFLAIIIQPDILSHIEYDNQKIIESALFYHGKMCNYCDLNRLFEIYKFILNDKIRNFIDGLLLI